MHKLSLLGCLLAAAACGDDGGSATIDAATTDGRVIDGPVIDAAVDAVIDAAIDAPSGPAVFTFDGIVGTGAPATGRIVVLWVVSSGSPDYAYKFGVGTSTGTQFMASFHAVPPAAAINSYGVGVGLVGLLSPTAAVPPDGIVNMQVDLVGFTPLHSVIYRDTTATPLPWIAPFPQGFSCGQCVQESNAFDSFEPVACSSVEIDLSPGPSCNWT